MYPSRLIVCIAVLLAAFVHLGILRKMKVSKVVWSCVQEMDLKSSVSVVLESVPGTRSCLQGTEVGCVPGFQPLL